MQSCRPIVWPTPEARARFRALCLKKSSCNRHVDPWPLHSNALACLPEQKKEFEQWAASKGVPTEWKQEGFMCKPVLNSRAHRRQLLRVVGVHDTDGGYSD